MTKNDIGAFVDEISDYERDVLTKAFAKWPIGKIVIKNSGFTSFPEFVEGLKEEGVRYIYIKHDGRVPVQAYANNMKFVTIFSGNVLIVEPAVLHLHKLEL